MQALAIENEVIGYMNGKAIVKNENGEWFYVEVPEEFIIAGEQIADEDLAPLELLPKQVRTGILKEMGDR
ncbi:hypothetical protein [Acetobacterium malicum]|uniref:hypothetical protein n=1 Tax=Acetobacterium malicum TaxID=52692 RepID=UPI000415C481|nr:hypothetical protein [Acetobacterium dehalogenans]PKM48576.1 MAG: hypothetical protein CVV01_02810 [Firmicutes bacterium HGW-Firmicutes-6]